MESEDGPTVPAGRLRRGLRRALSALPEGRALPREAWVARHRFIMALLWAHVPFLFGFALVRGFGLGHSLVEAGVVALFAGLAGIPGEGRKLRAILATVGLLTSSAVLVHVSGGTIEAHFHFFVMVGVIALYQDWTPFLVAVGYVLLHHGVGGVLDPTSVYNHPAAWENPWSWAGIHALFIAGACSVALVAWKLNEQARARAETYYRQLYEGEHALVERLEEVQRMKDELVAMVSHEFRTPITAILGLGRTMLAKGDRLAEEDRRDFLERSLRQAERLRLIVENLLQASRVVEPDLGATSEVDGVLEAVIGELDELPEGGRVEVARSIAPSTKVRISPEALHMIALNLLGNALKFAPEGSTVEVSAGPTEDERVAISISNLAPSVGRADLERMFEPFVQLDSSLTRETQGVGLGLSVVRRLAEIHGGDVAVDSREGRITFSVRLPTTTSPVTVPAG